MPDLPEFPALIPTDRILILGASGWFGTTLLRTLGSRYPVLGTASSQRPGFRTWDPKTVYEFAPTIVVNFAGLTRGHLKYLSPSDFHRMNQELLRQFVTAASLPGVRAVVTTSSGAAVVWPHSPYGTVKRKLEVASEALRTGSRSVIVARPYSVSGPYVRDPHAYAFSDLVLQAARGEMRVTATVPTYRRYTDAADLLTVCLRLAASGVSGIVESGGELVEVGELAGRIARILNPSARIYRETLTDTASDAYASDGRGWQRICAELAFEPADLDTQIRRTAMGLRPPQG